MIWLSAFFYLLAGWWLAEALVWSRGQDTIIYLVLAVMAFALANILDRQRDPKSTKRR